MAVLSLFLGGTLADHLLHSHLQAECIWKAQSWDPGPWTERESRASRGPRYRISHPPQASRAVVTDSRV